MEYYNTNTEFNEERLDVSDKIRRAGPFLLGPELGYSPVKCMKQCLARKEHTQDYYTLKILNIKSNKGSIDDQQGKILLFTEYSLLTQLADEPGIVRTYGLFKDEDGSGSKIDRKSATVTTDSSKSKFYLVLDGNVQHEFSPKAKQLRNLQAYVHRNKRLSEKEAVFIFRNFVEIVLRLHKRDIVHRDLKLGNVTLNVQTNELTLGNFCLGMKLESEEQWLSDQRGSPAYVSPDVISGNKYLGKPSDMWALGVAFYTMLYGKFPFYDTDPQELFRKIKAAEFKIPMDPYVSCTSVELIKSLLVLDPKSRLTAESILDSLNSYISLRYTPPIPNPAIQVVPFAPMPVSRKRPHSESNEEYAEDGVESPVKRPVTLSKSTNERVSLPKLANESRGESVIKANVSRVDFELEEILSSTSSQLDKDSKNIKLETLDSGIQEAPLKSTSLTLPSTSGLRGIKVLRVSEDARVLSCGDLEKLYAIYIANKAKTEQPRAPNNSGRTESASHILGISTNNERRGMIPGANERRGSPSLLANGERAQISANERRESISEGGNLGEVVDERRTDNEPSSISNVIKTRFLGNGRREGTQLTRSVPVA